MPRQPASLPGNTARAAPSSPPRMTHPASMPPDQDLQSPALSALHNGPETQDDGRGRSQPPTSQASHRDIYLSAFFAPVFQHF
ncbi:hypothetical protein CTA2_11082 [Colletotrichum tanaceti]|nr:hypothetical protein CTA2_11082 [Colletotrichum tanaceti]